MNERGRIGVLIVSLSVGSDSRLVKEGKEGRVGGGHSKC